MGKTKQRLHPDTLTRIVKLKRRNGKSNFLPIKMTDRPKSRASLKVAQGRQ